MPTPDLRKIEAALKAAAERKTYRKLDFYRPYPKQEQFIELSATHRETMLRGGNRTGKSDTGAAIVAIHATGEYPAWWRGKRFNNPVRIWCAGVSADAVRGIQQTKLCGPYGNPEALGTGYIPKESIADKPSLSRGVTDAYDTVLVRHKTGGVSSIQFKSYEQGREKFQGEACHVVWLDEEPDPEVYSESLARIGDTEGILFVTFTPLKGRTTMVDKFLGEQHPDRAEVNITLYEAEHLSEAQRQKIIDGYPAHEKEARINGTPMMGEGRVFDGISQEMITEETLEYLPPHWVKLWGIDFGINHPFAAVLIAWDKDNDCIHILNALRMRDALPLQHAAAMKPIALNVPVAWPHDGHVRDKGGGDPLSTLYRKEGLRMLPTHATHPDGSISTEAAIAEMQARMTTGRLRVAKHLSDWLEEFREYHRKDGMIVKQRDDLLSATMKALMMKRYAQAVPLGGNKKPRRGDGIAEGVEFDVFA